MTNVIVVVGAGSIGQAIARRVSAGKRILLADLKKESADAAAKVLDDAGFEASTAVVDVSSRDSVHALVETAVGLGNVTGLVHAAGVSPSQRPPRSSRSTCMGPHWFWKSSATSSRKAVPALSSRRSRGTGCRG